MRWLVGIDTAPGHEGPLYFCTWLFKRAEFSNALIAGHVAPRWPVFAGEVAFDLPGSLEIDARTTVEHEVKRCGAQELLQTIAITSDHDISQGLLRLCHDNHAQTLVLGRRAGHDEARVVRLGRTVRRALRHTDLPTIIVPPDFVRSEDIGPIVLTTDLERNSVSAAQYAVLLATRFRLPLHVVYVAAPESWTAAYVPTDAINLFREQARSSGAARLSAWAAQHHIPGTVTRSVLVGDPTAQVGAYAQSIGAAMIVTGSRGHEDKGLVFGYSVSMEIAASATVPVAVVPAQSSV